MIVDRGAPQRRSRRPDRPPRRPLRAGRRRHLPRARVPQGGRPDPRRPASRRCGLSEEGRLTELPDVGDTIAAKVTRAARDRHRWPRSSKLEAKYPPGLVDIMRLPGVGAKTTRKLFDALGVTTIDELRVACETERVRDVAGLGAKAEEKILAAIAAGGGARKGAILLDRALGAGRGAAGGPARAPRLRRGERGGLAAAPARDGRRHRPDRRQRRRRRRCSRRSRACRAVAEVTARGDTKASIVTHDGIAGRPPRRAAGVVRQPAAALHRLEGAQRRDARGGRAARPVDLRVGHRPRSRRGVVHRMATEDEVYAFLGYAPIPPEAAREHAASWSWRARARSRASSSSATSAATCTRTRPRPTGTASIAEMAAAAMERGYEYLAITDHSHGVGMGIGLEPEECLAHAARIREHAATLPDRLPPAGRRRGRRDERRDALLPGRRAGVARLGRRVRAPEPAPRPRPDDGAARRGRVEPARRRDRPSVGPPARRRGSRTTSTSRR